MTRFSVGFLAACLLLSAGLFLVEQSRDINYSHFAEALGERSLTASEVAGSHDFSHLPLKED